MNAKLGGCLIGYGLKKKNGEFKKVIFDKPIHNTITKHCLNNLLTFDGTDAQPTANYTGNWLSLFVKSSQTSNRYGVINSCCLGDGTGETLVNDTDLKHRVSAQTTTKKTGSGWCGTTFDNNNAIIKLRISHTHAISQDFTIKEIGWYNAINESGVLNYTLSARVQLDEFIDVENGDTFYSIYELSISFQDVEKFSDFAGLGVGGYKVNAGNNDGNAYFPLIDENGVPTGHGTSNIQRFCPVIYPPYMVNVKISTSSYGAYDHSSVCFGTNDIDKKKPFIVPQGYGQYGFFNFGGNRGAVTSASDEIITYKSYTADSFRRDYDVVFTFPSSSNLYYGFICNGTFYRFGTFDESDNFTPTPVTINGALRLTVRQSWSTDLLTPAP